MKRKRKKLTAEFWREDARLMKELEARIVELERRVAEKREG